MTTWVTMEERVPKNDYMFTWLWTEGQSVRMGTYLGNGNWKPIDYEPTHWAVIEWPAPLPEPVAYNLDGSRQGDW